MSGSGLGFLLLSVSSLGYLVASIESIQHIPILRKFAEAGNIIVLFFVSLLICFAIMLINTTGDVIKGGSEVLHLLLLVALLIVLALDILIIIYSFYVSDQSLFVNIPFKMVRILFRIVRYVYALQCIIALFVFIRYFLTNLK